MRHDDGTVRYGDSCLCSWMGPAAGLQGKRETEKKKR
jgi:hypothetical protein